MILSKGFWQTYKEVPADAEIPSHQLMVRAGLIHKSGAGLYNYLPMGLRSIQKVESIIREEHNKLGFLELTMTMVTPGELWRESGRWDKMEGLMIQMKDKGDRDLCLSPTNEEAITDIFRKTVKSYKQLPVSLYQINTKFRDEIRPRYGLMRGREFIMKDAYSFGIDKKSLDETYDQFYKVYSNIFSRIGLNFMAVEADAGAMGDGDSKTHEFQVIADNGEDHLVYADGYAANIEKAKTKRKSTEFNKTTDALEKVETKNATTIKEVCSLLNAPEHQCLKALLYTALYGEKEVHYAIFVLGDDNLNELKLKNFLKADMVFQTRDDVLKEKNIPAGYLGPVNIGLPVVFDEAIPIDSAFIVGAMEKNYHFKNFIPERDCEKFKTADLREAISGDIAPNGNTVEIKKGIEVGHIFQLGNKYTKAMGTTVQDQNGKEVYPLMGCYGIGVTRTVAASIEQNHDENGIVWPAAIAPYHVYFATIAKSEEIKNLAIEIYNDLNQHNIETVLDDRNVGPGFKFKDADLLGLPVRVLLGERDYKEDGLLEIKVRKSGEVFKVSKDDLKPKLIELLKGL